jgi:hypothetical protein
METEKANMDNREISNHIWRMAESIQKEKLVKENSKHAIGRPKPSCVRIKPWHSSMGYLVVPRGIHVKSILRR